MANETNLALREYILNRPEKKNALNTEMIDLLWMYLQVSRQLASKTMEKLMKLCSVGINLERRGLFLQVELVDPSVPEET